MNNNNLYGIFSIIIAVQLLPFSDITSKYLALSLPLLQVLWGRFFFHALFTGIYTFVKYDLKTLNPLSSYIAVLRGAALLLAVGCLYVTISRVPLTTGLTLWFVEPFFLILLSAVVLKTKIHKIQWISVFIGFAGVVVAIRPIVTPFDIAYVTGLLSGFFYALFLFLTHYIDNKSPKIAQVFHTGIVGAVVCSFATIPVWQTPTINEIGLLMFSGIIAAIAHIYIIRAFEKTKPDILAPYTYSEIIMAAILGYLVFSDYPDIYLIIGICMIIFSGILAEKYKA